MSIPLESLFQQPARHLRHPRHFRTLAFAPIPRYVRYWSEVRTMKAVISALAILTALAATTAAQQFFGRFQGPDSLILQGPGSDVRATVSVLPESRRPEGRSGVVVE